MKPKIKWTGIKWIVFGWHARFYLLFDSWTEALRAALKIASAQRRGGHFAISGTLVKTPDEMKTLPAVTKTATLPNAGRLLKAKAA